MRFRITIFSFVSLAPAEVAIRKTFERLQTEGVVGTRKDLTPKALFEICGLEDSMTIDFEAGGEAFVAV
jgi:methylisocitrate lyase